MNNLGIDKNINKIQTVNVTGGDAASAADAPILTESGFGRVFDGAKKRLSDQSGAAPSGNDLPMGALCIVPISPAVNVLTSIAGEISDDVIRTYARQQGLNPAVLGVILGHGFPDGGTPATQSVLAATLGLPACPSDHALTAGLRAVTPGLTVGHVAVEGVVGRLGSKLKSSAGAAGEMMAAQVLGSLGNSSVPSPDIQSENGAVNEPLLAGFPTEGGAGMRALATTGRWRGVTGAADATGGVSQIAIDQPMQLPQQTGQIRQAALPIASIVAGQLTQSLKFERVAAQYAQAPAPPAESPQMKAWKARAEGVTIIRDDWGVPHIYAKTDADVVFGLMFAQAEDDFNRVETNFINSQGRLAEAEGEKEIWRDLRMKLFIDPADLKAKYAESPASLKALMDAWADGLNFYLATHPNVKPRVLTKIGRAHV